MKASDIQTIQDMDNYCRSVVEGLTIGKIGSHEAMKALKDYTNRVVHLSNKFKSGIVQKHRLQMAIQNQSVPTEYFEKIHHETRSKVPMP